MGWKEREKNGKAKGKMRTLLLVAVAVAFTFTDLEIADIVDKFNEKRSIVAQGLETRGLSGPQPAAANMVALQWDETLAKVAQDYADQCISSGALIDHNGGRSADYEALGGSGYVGENIYGSTGLSSTAGLALDSIDSWYDEVADYDFATDTCAGVCGHYTQVVWANTSLVGCAYVHCPSVTYSYIILCNFWLGGNYAGEALYETGDACTMCPENFTECNSDTNYLCDDGSLTSMSVFAFLFALF